MWLSKFLDLTEDIKGMESEIKKFLFKDRKQKKLTPLEFTILESIFNSQGVSGYDLIQQLNAHFAGTWEAKSGTTYPILSKLKRNGFLTIRQVKSPIGPLKKLYFLTKAGETVLKLKVNKSYFQQVNFMGNFLIELSTIYVRSFPEKDKVEKTKEVQKLLRETFDRVFENIPLNIDFKVKCPNCNAVLERSSAAFCSLCGASLHATSADEGGDFAPAEEINGVG